MELSLITCNLDKSAGTTWNDGFSVVEPIKNNVPFSRCGRSASCWVFEYLWISSINKIVLTPLLKAFLALSTASLISLTPEVTAEISIKFAFVFVAISLASVVLPQPGVPHRIIEKSLFVLSKFKIGLFGDTTLLCPRNSSRVFGRKVSASGICLF